MRRVVRVSNRTPSRASSRPSCFDMAEGVRPRSRAAGGEAARLHDPDEGGHVGGLAHCGPAVTSVGPECPIIADADQIHFLLPEEDPMAHRHLPSPARPPVMA